MVFGRESFYRDSVFGIGSITNVFTGIALAQEVDLGHVSLDQPVEELLPRDVELPGAVCSRISMVLARGRQSSE